MTKQWRKPAYPGEYPTLGWGIVDFIETYLRVPAGDGTGQPLKLTDEQVLFICAAHRIHPVSGKWFYRRSVLRRPKGWGKPLALETPIPTTGGFKRMGDLQIGDMVYGPDGSVRPVVNVGEVLTNEPTFEVRLDDGAALVAGAGHLWRLRDLRRGYAERIVTTAEIAAEVRVPGKSPACRWSVTNIEPIEGTHIEMGLHPWLLGFWLGDGDSDSPRLTVGDHDFAQVVSILEDLGVGWNTQRGNRTSHRISVGSGIHGVRGSNVVSNALRALNVLHNKHIPAAVLRSSIEQRMFVLQGLVDSDGHVATNGTIEITVTCEALAHDAAELARTLGLKVALHEDRAKIMGVDKGPRWRVRFSAPPGFVVAKFARKQAKLDAYHGRARSTRTGLGVQGRLSATRRIVSVEPVHSVPMRCITVGHEDGMFLAGEHFVPTHNSPVVGAVALAHLAGPVVFDGWDSHGDPVGKQHPSPWVQVAATAEDQTDNTWAPVMSMTAESSADELGLDVGLTRIFLKGRPGRMEPVTAKAPSKEGTPVTFCVMDETHLWTPTNGGQKLAATLRRNVGKTAGLTIETTNAHRPGEGSVAEDSFEAAQRATADVFYDSLEGPQLDDLDDLPALMASLQVAYGSATWVDLERIAAECTDPATDPVDARRFYLNQLVASESDAVELALWDAVALPAARLADGDRITIGFDGSEGGDSTALVAMRHDDRCLFVLGVWERPEGVKRADWDVPRLEVRATVCEAFEKYRVARMYCDPPYWQTDIDEWRSMFGDVVNRWPTYSDTKMVEATARFDTLLRAGELRHTGDPRLRRHVAAAQRQRCRQGWRPAKKDARKIDLLVAALGAVHAHGDAVANGLLSDSTPLVFAY